ncbi:long-chain-fatty-acid--CoA ligase [Pseudomonas sp. Pseusp97]|uniref:long-chain-fatty-acid--CoA ligase n=1 Tax=Pseudomonas sp. Pseusp97 TaxID=3243065 RepID=UPI0039A552A0
MYFTQGLHRQLQQRPQSTAVICGERQLTFADLGERVARLAGALRELGLQGGDCVAMLSRNSERYIEYSLAVPWADGVLNPVNTRWSVAEIVYSLDDSQSTILIVDDHFADAAEQIARQAKTIRHVIHAGNGAAPDGMLSYEALIAGASPMEDVRRGGDQLLGIFYTGGTTGFPKGVMLSHSNFAFAALAPQSEGFFTRESIYLHAMPMFHVADFSGLYGLLLSGGVHVVLPAFSGEAALDAICRHGVNELLMAPTMIQMLLGACASSQGPAQDCLHQVRRILYGASPITSALLDQACARFTSARFFQGYGMTETTAAGTLLLPEFHSAEHQADGRMYSAGRASACVEIRIVDEQDQEVPRGIVGEIVIRGPSVMLGYWQRPEITAEVLRDGWMHTGDGGYMDEQGFVFIVDRLKDMIVSGGENVYCAEVESALASHPAVAQCAVIGIPSGKWGEAVHAVIVLKAGWQVEEAELVSHCRERIAGYKCPRSVEFREALPLSGVGKVLKHELRKRHWEGHARGIA